MPRMVQILQGDCLEILRAMPAESVDSIVTDPPYCSVGQSAAWVNVRGISLPNEIQYFEAWAREILAELVRVLRDDGAMWIACDLDGLFAWRSAARRLGLKFKHGVWDKEQIGMGHLLRNSHEFFAIVATRKYKRLSASEPDLWRSKWSPGRRDTEHQAEKPVDLMRRAIRLVTPVGGTVLDPFAGSGTTGLAAQAEGFDAILVEREPVYVTLCEARNASLCLARGIAALGPQ